ncbi:hypothetical protein J1N35_021904 [Gossypium stocksii]|uniref:Uncharacterized protein n=1 Tax=Gossypium stocksii TaxID=47602 RepID=A0A9D3VFQ0_9ROSI|nr:hypothetical protein J1N35_021904 [Gossypium stocksii]
MRAAKPDGSCSPPFFPMNSQHLSNLDWNDARESFKQVQVLQMAGKDHRKVG